MIKLNGDTISIDKFEDNTIQPSISRLDQIEKIKEQIVNEIYWDFENPGELIVVIQLIDLIWANNEDPYIVLNCPYLPYGYNHKEIVPNGHGPLALSTFVRVLGHFVISELKIFDYKYGDYLTHPSIPINTISNESPLPKIKEIIDSHKIDYVIYLNSDDHLMYSSIQQLSAIPFSVGPEIDYKSIMDNVTVLLITNYCGSLESKCIAEYINPIKSANIIMYASHIVNSNSFNELGISKIFYGTKK